MSRTTMKVLLAAIALGCATTAVGQTSATFRLAHTLPAGSPWAAATEQLARRVETATNGRLKITPFPSGQLGNDVAALQGLQSGTIEMALLPIPMLAARVPELNVFELPFLFQDLGAVSRFQKSEQGPKLLQALDRAGVKGLAFWLGPMAVLASSSNPIVKPEDVKGAKVAFVRAPDLAAKAFVNLGANPVQYASADLFGALQAGSANAVDTTPSTLVAFKLTQLEKHVTLTNHAYFGYVLLVSASRWNQLAPELRKAVEDTVSEVTPNANDQIAAFLGATLASMSKQVPVRALSVSEHEAWRRGVEPTWQDFAKTGSNQLLVQAALAAGGTGGGGDPCAVDECRCKNRSCSKDCCTK